MVSMTKESYIPWRHECASPPRRGFLTLVGISKELFGDLEEHFDLFCRDPNLDLKETCGTRYDLGSYLGRTTQRHMERDAI